MRTMWTDSKVETHLSEICKGLGRMPSSRDLQNLGRNDLCVQITRRGGFLHWAKHVGFLRKISDSDKGWAGEIRLAEILCDRGFSAVRVPGVKAAFDLIVNEVVRVDVKTAKYAEYGACKGWFYRTGKIVQADILALFQMDTEECYFLPWTIAPSTNITISRTGGKYASAKGRYDILCELVEKRLAEKDLWPLSA